MSIGLPRGVRLTPNTPLSHTYNSYVGHHPAFGSTKSSSALTLSITYLSEMIKVHTFRSDALGSSWRWLNSGTSSRHLKFSKLRTDARLSQH